MIVTRRLETKQGVGHLSLAWPRRLRAGLLHSGIVALFAVLAMARDWPVMLHPRTMVAPDAIDPLFHVWSVSATLHQLTSWAQGLWSLFDHNIFYPTPHAGAYGNVAVGILPFSLPLSLVVHNPILLLNVLVILSFALAAYGAFLLARFLTGNTVAAIIAGLVCTFFPLRAEHIGHLNLLFADAWLPLSVYSLVRAWHSGRYSWWALGGLLVGLMSITSLYQLAYMGAPAALIGVALRRAWTRRRARGAALAGAIAACLVGPFMIPYMQRHAVPNPLPVPSTDVLSFLTVFAGRPLDSIVLPSVPIQILQPAHGYFPGFIVLGLAIMAWRRRRGRLWALFTVACIVEALGPVLIIGRHTLPLPLPYAALSAVVPYFSLFRDPTRALTGAALALSILAAYGARGVVAWAHKHARERLAVALLLGLVALESWTPIPSVPVPPIPAGERWLATQPWIHAVVELPLANATPRDWARQTEIMYDSTAHWKRLVNGSSSVTPLGVPQRTAILSTYPSPRSLSLLRQLHVDAVVLRVAWLPRTQLAAARAACHVAYHDRDEIVCTGPWQTDG